MHDYFSGMICLRDGGTQMPTMIRRYSNKGIFTVYNIFLCVLLLLVGAVFVYTPGDIAATQVFGFDGKATSMSTWVIYGVIFVYYLIATVFPIDAIIGRIYPIFGAILMFSAVGVFIGIFAKGYPLLNLWDEWVAPMGFNGAEPFNYQNYFDANHFLPVFFVTVACGILSGFHSTQTAIITRTMKSERQGRTTFYWMMILEGFIAMVWAAGAMGAYNLGLQEANASMATATIGVVCKDILGPVGGIIALLGVIVLPVTSGDTALRALRLTVSESFHMDQSSNAKRLTLAVPMFVLVAAIIVWAKFNSDGFNILWRYFAWSIDIRIACSPSWPSPCDVREQEGQVRVDPPDPRRLVHLHLRHLHRQCPDRLPYPLDSRLRHRRLRRCRLCGRGHLVWQEACRSPGQGLSEIPDPNKNSPAERRDCFLCP